MRPPALATQTGLALALTLAVGLGLGHVWTQAGRDWAAHLDRAGQAGVALYASLVLPGLPAPQGLHLTRLPPGSGPPFDDLPRPARETRLSLLDLTRTDGAPASGARRGDRLRPDPNPDINPGSGPATDPVPGGARLALSIVSPGLTFPAAGLDSRVANPAERLGQITRAMARQCSDWVLFARRDIGGWVRIDGGAVWSCAALPPDRRLPATLAAALILAGILSWLVSQRTALERVIAALTDRFAGGAFGHVLRTGPAELHALAEAANAMTAREAARLESRAAILAGISHDLGTPMTRLRLRAALIADPDLRARIGRDIDQMNDMIDGVLSHTRSEMATEAPRLVSVLSLVQSVAHDFADLGAPVRLRDPQTQRPEPAASLFAGAAPRRRRGTDAGTGMGKGTGKGTDTGGPISGSSAAGSMVSGGDRRMLALCRPNALRRAVTNLVDNALKYGRRAEIAIEDEADTLTISVQDAGGGGLRASDLGELIAPFSRGANAAQMRGAGMGLTIVDGIARQHGGGLQFVDADGGIMARLTIRRT